MATALVALANVTLGANASTVTFSSIAGTYRDLILVTVNNPVNTGSQPGIRFNGDTGSNYTYGAALGNGSSTSSYWFGEFYIGLNDFNADTARSITHIMDYAATDKHKSVIIKSDQNGANVTMIAGRWANTAAITSITCMRSSSDLFAAGSTFALYGVLA
jgi:hypothetical protein